MPQRSAPKNPVANETESLAPTNIKPKARPKPDEPDAIDYEFQQRPFELKGMWRVNGWGKRFAEIRNHGLPCGDTTPCFWRFPSERLLNPGVGTLEVQSSEPTENGIRFYFGADGKVALVTGVVRLRCVCGGVLTRVQAARLASGRPL